MTRRFIFFGCFFVFFLCACQNPLFLYRPDSVQGNIFPIGQNPAALTGKNKEYVRTLLGTPTLQDPFHPNQDVYIFTYKSGTSQKTYRRSLTLYYVDNEVASVQAMPLTIQ